MRQPTSAIIHLVAGQFHAEISPFGAALVRFRMNDRDLILGLNDAQMHAQNDFYAGATVGPVANRITKGLVEVNGQFCQMERNEDNLNALHSGTDGLHRQTWVVKDTTRTSASLTCHLADGHSGLPGNRKITVQYELDETALTVTIYAQTDQQTPINIAHHPYWALEPDQSKTELMISAQTYLPKDGFGLPEGHQLPVENSSFDFRTLRPIGPNSLIDHNWCLDIEKHETPRHIATLRAQDGLQLYIETTEVGLQVYTGSALPLLPPSLCNGVQITANAGIALEPQGWPDAPNQPTFPNIMLDRGKTYQQITRYTVSKTPVS